MNVSPPTSSVDCRPSQRSAVVRNADDHIHRKRAAFFTERLSRYIEPGSSLLDVGAGDGLLAANLSSKLNLKARAFDVEARGLGPFPVEVYDGKHIPLADSAVEITICVAVLHHCDDLSQVLREIRRVTRRRFLLVDDRYDTFWQRVGVVGFHHYLNWIESMPFHKSGFASTQGWTQRLADAGFKVVQVQPLGKPIRWFPVSNTLFVAE
ncbi:MAG: class I SAM-dependent methyltransferase [Phycisphaeraceae bacterium]|nr:class I SAM-dependent methyltransferase [Phycisphaeraceae bacterium]